jgi:hypothetical protein
MSLLTLLRHVLAWDTRTVLLTTSRLCISIHSPAAVVENPHTASGVWRGGVLYAALMLHAVSLLLLHVSLAVVAAVTGPEQSGLHPRILVVP